MAESKSLTEIKQFTSASMHFLYLPTKSTSNDPSPQDAIGKCVKPGKEVAVQEVLTKLASTRRQLSTTLTTLNEAPFHRNIFTAEHQVDLEAVERELRAYLSVVKGFTKDVPDENVTTDSSGEDKADEGTTGEEKTADDKTENNAESRTDPPRQEDGSLSDLLAFLDWKDVYSDHPAMMVTGSDMETASAVFATGISLFSHVCRIGDGIGREDSNVSEEIVKRSYKVLLFAATLFDYADEYTKKCTKAGSDDSSDMLVTSDQKTVSSVMKDLCFAEAQEFTLRQGAASRTSPQVLSEICADSHAKYAKVGGALKSLPVSSRHSPGKQIPSMLNLLRSFAEWKSSYYQALALYYIGLVEWSKDNAEGCGKSLAAFKQSIVVFESLDQTNSALEDYTFLLPQGEEREKRSELARKSVTMAKRNTELCRDVAEGRNRVYNELVRDDEVHLPEEKSPLKPLEPFKEVDIDEVWTEDMKKAFDPSIAPVTKKSDGCCIVL